MQLVTGLDRFFFYMSWAFVSHGQKGPRSSSFMRAASPPTLAVAGADAHACVFSCALLGLGPSRTARRPIYAIESASRETSSPHLHQ